MKSRATLFTVFSLSLFALATLITIVLNTSPNNPPEIFAFFISLVVALVGIFTFGLYGYGIMKTHSTPGWIEVAGYLKQAIILSIGVTIILALRSYKLINGQSLAILIVGLIIGSLLVKKVRAGSTT